MAKCIKRMITFTSKINVLQWSNTKMFNGAKEKGREKTKWVKRMFSGTNKINILKLSNTKNIDDTKEKGREMAKGVKRMITSTHKINILILSRSKKIYETKEEGREKTKSIKQMITCRKNWREERITKRNEEVHWKNDNLGPVKSKINKLLNTKKIVDTKEKGRQMAKWVKNMITCTQKFSRTKKIGERKE